MTQRHLHPHTHPVAEGTRELIVLVKFFRELEHAEIFLDGTLRAQRLKFFRRLEGEDPQRGDKREGSILLDEDWQLSITDDDGTPVPIETVGPVQINHASVDNLHVFCMSALRIHANDHDDVSPETVTDALRSQFRASLAEFEAMGKHAVLIPASETFLQRLRKAAESVGYQYWNAHVRYYRSYPLEFAMKFEKPLVQRAFLKPKSFELQREFRIVLNTRTVGDDHRELDIGSIRDIAGRVATSSLVILRARPL